MFTCHLHKMLSGNVVIFVEFSVLHWHFNLVLNSSVMIAQVAMRVYMFHGRQFRAPVMSSFFCSYELYDDITLDEVHPPFHPPMNPTNGESDSKRT